MNSTIKELAEQCYEKHPLLDTFQFNQEKFARLVIQECINKIENYPIPVGNSASGELACEWTYEALKQIRHDIKETFGVE